MEELKRFCPHCGGEIKEGEKFCTYCGSRIDPETFDERESSNGETHNQHNNSSQNIYYAPQEEEKPKKKSKVVSIIILVIVALVAIYGISSYNNYIKRINAVNAAGDFYNAVIADAPILEKIGNDIQTEWNEAIWGNTYDSIDDAIKAATDKNSEDISTVIDNYSKITSLYQEATSLLGPLDDKQALNDSVKNLYDKYVDLYNIVINFNCTYKEFCEDFSAADQKAASAVSTLYALLQ